MIAAVILYITDAAISDHRRHVSPFNVTFDDVKINEMVRLTITANFATILYTVVYLLKT